MREMISQYSKNSSSSSSTTTNSSTQLKVTFTVESVVAGNGEVMVKMNEVIQRCYMVHGKYSDGGQVRRSCESCVAEINGVFLFFSNKSIGAAE